MGDADVEVLLSASMWTVVWSMKGGAHLAGEHALPDKLVQLHLILVQVGLQVVGVTEAGGGAYGLVGFLGALGPSLVGAR